MENTQTMRWEWYVIAACFPFVGVFVGIVAAAKNRVGPALALWATSWVAAVAWSVFLAATMWSQFTG
jgi:hypothetical protein